MLDVYIPPFSDDDSHPPLQLFILFLEAIARVVPDAFIGLRDTILPLYIADRKAFPSREMDAWLDRWHLRFPNCDLSERTSEWIIQLLMYWANCPEAASRLSVDIGYWNAHPKIGHGYDKPQIPLALSQWNPFREDFEVYATRLRGRFETLLQEQRRTHEQEMVSYGIKPYRKRSSNGRKPLWDFEWVALHQCAGWTDQRIAKQQTRYPRMSEDAIKKARQRLEAKLKFDVSGERDTTE